MASQPLPLTAAHINDPFWSREIDLIRNAVIPYQWDALNDRIPNAAPSWWMHNMKAAARAIAAKKAGKYAPHQKLPFIVIEPDKNEAPKEDDFYGWAFQDSDGYKWIEAVSYQLMLHTDTKLQAQAQLAVDAICSAQEDDGYLDTFYTVINREKAFTNLKDHHELYCFGHLVEAAVAWYQATGHTELLEAAKRFGRCISNRFGPGMQRGCPGHEIAEMALFKLYALTGETEWRDLACFFLDVRGTEPSSFAIEENTRRTKEGLEQLDLSCARYAYYQAHLPVRSMREATGHAVRQMYLCSGMADAARETGDAEMLAACKRLWHSTVHEKMYVTGGVGSTHDGEAFSRPYDLPSDTAYSETCAAIGLVFFARRMLQLEPKGEYADVMERALYNTVLAGMALDGKSFFYVNPLEVDPEACAGDSRLKHVKAERQKWFSCACCPPNIARLISSLPAYVITQSEDTAYVHLYIGGDYCVSLNDAQISIHMDADLMQNGNIKVTIAAGSGTGTLAFRIPEWTKDPQFHADGKIMSIKDGYCYIEGTWNTGDTISIEFPMLVRMLTASPMVRETADMLCVSRGPWVYCAEEADNGKLLHLLRISAQAADIASVDSIKIGDLKIPSITLPGVRVQVPETDALYDDWKRPEEQPVPIRLVPYFAWNNRGKGEMRVWLHQRIGISK